MILNYLLASGWTHAEIIRTGATLTVALLALAGAVLGLERLLKRADAERAAVLVPFASMLKHAEGGEMPPLPQCIPGKTLDEHGDEAIAMAKGGRTEYPESFVLHSGSDDMGGQLCFDCGEEAGMHMPWAVSVQSSAVVLIEAALCFKCASMETSTATEEEQS